MSDIITYLYAQPSAFIKSDNKQSLILSLFSEIANNKSSCFFSGRLTDPYTTARCLLALSNVVQSSFNLSPYEIAKQKDPVVTAGNETIRFEGFSHCAGVYARVDILPGAHEGRFPETGTTNVDFNQRMISALSRIQRREPLDLSVGSKEIIVNHDGNFIMERKVPLPVKWIRGMASVQVYLSTSEKQYTFSRMQALQLFQSLPKGNPRTDYYLVVRSGKSVFSAIKTKEGTCIGGVHRLKLLEPLLPLADEVKIFVEPHDQSTTWVLYFGRVRFSLTISRDAWRGFSGEGATLDALIEELPELLIESFDQYAFANEAFNPAMVAIKENISIDTMDQLTARLAAIGLLGFDLDDNCFFYRRLPFKPSRILSLNPRLKAANKLLAENKVDIISNNKNRVEARVLGSGVNHTVILENESVRCTCTWFSRHQGERGMCKHILAVKKKLNG